jgi:hypothetical protein
MNIVDYLLIYTGFFFSFEFLFEITGHLLDMCIFNIS